ncbi:hypothetical protein [Sphingomonas oryzagri]
MAPLGNGELRIRRPDVRAAAACRNCGRTAAFTIAVLAFLMVVGRGVAVALGSPLLAIVAVGMTFLIGVATFGAVDANRR